MQYEWWRDPRRDIDLSPVKQPRSTESTLALSRTVPVIWAYAYVSVDVCNSLYYLEVGDTIHKLLLAIDCLADL